MLIGPWLINLDQWVSALQHLFHHVQCHDPTKLSPLYTSNYPGYACHPSISIPKNLVETGNRPALPVPRTQIGITLRAASGGRHAPWDSICTQGPPQSTPTNEILSHMKCHWWLSRLNLLNQLPLWWETVAYKQNIYEPTNRKTSPTLQKNY